MSGGSLDYFYCKLQEHVGDFGDKELDALVGDLAELFHDREWYLSGDYGEGEWNEARDKFKQKWFSEGARAERIEKYLAEVKTELLHSFGIASNYCKDCKNWAVESETYGKCKFAQGYLNHRCDTCEKWEAKDGNRS
jgi:hypothetical protein